MSDHDPVTPEKNPVLSESFKSRKRLRSTTESFVSSCSDERHCDRILSARSLMNDGSDLVFSIYAKDAAILAPPPISAGNNDAHIDFGLLLNA